MAASEAAVNAVMEALEYHGRYMEIPNGQVSCHCGETGWVTRAEYRKHVAVAVADAAIDADRASIQAETLREAAAEAFQVAVVGQTPQRDLEPGEAEWFWGHELAKDDAFDHPSRAASRWLRARADRIEAQP
jgi:hypothetical protein